MPYFIALFLGLSLVFSGCSDDEKEQASKALKAKSKGGIIIIVDTTMGEIALELDPTRAPATVKNFLKYVDAGFYEGTIFHRVIPNFMIQGGGYLKNLQKQKGLKTPVTNEAAHNNNWSNKRGTVAMARTSQINSATSQFFINLIDNTRLDHRGKEPRKYGYAVFGYVIQGMEIVDKIAGVQTQCPSSAAGGVCEAALPPGMRDVPAEPVLINSIKRFDN
tara:strand:+ start:112 stop:771 length:660 start_codon:yes stop_codon:yes gene_type:complete